MENELTLGNMLMNISETCGNTREQIKTEFLERIKGHPEEKILMECYDAACEGKKSIMLRKNAVPPESLELEGFFVERGRKGLIYGWE